LKGRLKAREASAEQGGSAGFARGGAAEAHQLGDASPIDRTGERVKQVFISDIRKDTEVRDFFLVAKKAIYSSRNNTRYASVKLKDRTGSIEARIWDRTDELCANFERNDIVYVESKAKLYQDQLQLSITNIRKEERLFGADDIREFYPESSSGAEQLREDFLRLTDEIEDKHLAGLLAQLNARKGMVDRYFLMPASVGIHHVSIGGLIEHSVSVAKMGKQAARLVGGDQDVIVVGSLLHDIGKIEEIGFAGGGFGYTDRGRLLGHIALGIVMLEDLVSSADGFPAPLADVLKHIIVSHHGETEWGSPKKPMCIEALVVHYLDNLDAKVMGVKEHMETAMEDERWSQFHKIYESRFYKIPER
jgi:3'-5' exoribonuclease